MWAAPETGARHQGWDYPDKVSRGRGQWPSYRPECRPQVWKPESETFLGSGSHAAFPSRQGPRISTNANGNGVTTNIYEEVGNILIGLRIIRLRQTKLDIGLSLPEPEPPELRTPHINIWDMIYNKREGGSVLPRQPGWSPPAGSQGWTGPWSCWRTTGYRSSPRPEVGPPRSSARPGTGFRTWCCPPDWAPPCGTSARGRRRTPSRRRRGCRPESG